MSSFGDQVVLFGGYAKANLNDTWMFNGSRWYELTPTTSPTARTAASMAYRP
jgi:hypothetical protein